LESAGTMVSAEFKIGRGVPAEFNLVSCIELIYEIRINRYRSIFNLLRRGLQLAVGFQLNLILYLVLNLSAKF